MIDAEVFLANLRNSHSVPAVFQRFASRDLPGLPFPVVRALNRGMGNCASAGPLRLRVSQEVNGLRSGLGPVLSVPIARENSDCHWAVEIGNGLLVLEVNTRGLAALAARTFRDAWEWRETLRFRCGATHFFAFQHAGRRVRFLGSRFQGLRTHWNGSAVLIPPSRFVFGPPVAYASDPEASVVDAPAWLLD